MLISKVYSLYIIHGLCYHAVTGGHSTWGQQFVISFLSNFEKKGTIYIRMVTKTATSVYVDIPLESRTESFTVLANSEEIVQLQWNNRYEENLEVVKKAVFINSTSPIAVYSHSYVSNSGSGFLALPVNVLGDHYIAVSYTKDSFNTSFVVAAAEDATEVVVHYITRGGKCGPYNYTTGDTSTHMLDRQDVVGVHCTEDLTGTWITSNRPVSVVSGNVGGKVPVGAGGKDVMEEMLIPVKDFGFEYVLTNTGRKESSINRIVALADNTTVWSSTGDVYHLNTSDFVDIDTATHGEQSISSSTPVMAVAFGKGISANSDRLGDPSLVVIPPTSSFSNDYFLVSSLGQGVNGYIGSDFLTVVASLDSIGMLETMLSANHTPLSNSDYGIIHTQLTTWPLQLLTDNATYFGATLYSVSSRYRGVALPLGMVLEPQKCWSSTCLNNGICHEVNDTFVCECAIGFNGENCQHHSVAPVLTAVSPETSASSFATIDTIITTSSEPALTELSSTENIYASTALLTSFIDAYTISETESQLLTISPIPQTLSFVSIIPMQKELSSTSEATNTTIDVGAAVTTVASVGAEFTSTGAIVASLSLKTNIPQDSSSSVCVCLCKGARLEVLDDEAVKEFTDEIKEELILDTKTLSKTIRKFISAPDERKSAQNVGTLGIVLLCFTFGLMVIPDVLSCFKALHRTFKHRN